MAYDGIVRVVKDEDISTPHADAKYALGAKVWKNGNEYCYVYNANSALGTGRYCVPLTGTSGYSVTVTNASLAGVMAGVAQNTFTAAYYGFIMTKGVSLISTDSGEVSQAAGVELSLGTDGGFVAAGATFSTAPRYAYTAGSFVTGATSKARIYNAIF